MPECDSVFLKQQIKKELRKHLNDIQDKFYSELYSGNNKVDIFARQPNSMSPQSNTESPQYDVYLAGGAVRACVANDPINDFDFYFKNKDTFDIINELCLKNYQHTNSTDNAETFLVDNNGKSAKIQLVRLMFGTMGQIINSFDFTICQGAYSLITEKLYFGNDFLIDIASRRINITNHVNFPFVTAMRAIKYHNYGYNLSVVNHLKILLKCHAVKCATIEDWKKELLAVDVTYLIKLFQELETKNEKTTLNSQEFLEILESTFADKLPMDITQEDI